MVAVMMVVVIIEVVVMLFVAFLRSVKTYTIAVILKSFPRVSTSGELLLARKNFFGAYNSQCESRLGVFPRTTLSGHNRQEIAKSM